MLNKISAPRAALTLGACFILVSGCGSQSAPPNDGLDIAEAPVLSGNQAQCDVIVAGGSTAALSAALSSAREGKATCLLEPTDWAGGQLTSVPAVDFPHHVVGDVDLRVEGAKLANLAAEFHAWTLGSYAQSGRCSVSRVCYEPKAFLNAKVNPAIRAEPNLKVFFSTVVKRVNTTAQNNGSARNIVSIEAIARTPVANTTGYEAFLHDVLADWYSPTNSARYTKRTMTFTGRAGRNPVVIDATEFGDVLALSGATYLQGVDPTDGALTGQSESCGQATVFPFVIAMEGAAVNEPANPFRVEHPEFYGFGTYDFDKIWRYRRIRGTDLNVARPGDWSIQNWNPGNDFPYKYLFLSRADTNAQRADWKGGVNIQALKGAASHAYGWYDYYKSKATNGRGRNMRLLRQEALGTGHGLTKLPYLRDTRRSVGLDNFLLRFDDLTGEATASYPTGTRFNDRVGLGAYVADIHSIYDGCVSPRYLNEKILKVLPSYIPFRALTNRDFDNLLVAGKTMAQTYKANSALRLQPIEWHSGVAAGVAAAHMHRWNLSSRLLLTNVKDVQARIRKYQPTEWTLERYGRLPK